jgi:alpha-L-rhamnosidase
MNTAPKSLKWTSLAALAVVCLCGSSHARELAAGTEERFTVHRKPLVQEVVNPVRVVAQGDGKWFVDFGQAAFGRLELTIEHPEAGRKVTVRLGEMLSAPDRINRKPGASVRYQESVVALEAGKTLYRVDLPKRDERRMPPDIGAVMPFRYVELEDLPAGIGSEQLRAGAVGQVAVHYKFDDAAAEFSCADEKLNAVWALCKHSIKATSFAGVFVDGDRERKPYEADAYINQLGWYCCTGDVTLPRYTQEYLIQHPAWPTEWIMFSVLIGWDDYQYTGDTASLSAFYEDLKARTLHGLEREDGLISTVTPPVPPALLNAIHFDGKLKDIVDWPLAERDGCEMKPVNTVVNAFHCRALDLMGKMAAALGKTRDAEEFSLLSAKSAKALNQKLVDPQTGLYVDGEGSTHSSLHANMFPLAFGLVHPERRERVAAFVQSRGMACSVYGAQFLMDALFDNGRGDRALELMTAPGERSWRHMVEDVGTTITLEAWDTKYKPNQDWNHAWGAAPANLLPRKVLGIEPLEPGIAKVMIWPRAGKLAWAKVKVPASVELWRTHRRTIDPKSDEMFGMYELRGGPEPVVVEPDTVLPARDNRIEWYHRNERSIYSDVLKAQHLGPLLAKYPDPLLHRTFGGCMRGPGLVSADDHTLKSAKPATSHRLSITAYTAQTPSAQAWEKAIDALAANDGSGSLDDARTATEKWWEAFWDRSWIDITGDKKAEEVASGYALQRWVEACGGRGALPMKFNGSIFTVGKSFADPADKSKKIDVPDWRAWGSNYWFQNNRHLYWPLIVSGDYGRVVSPGSESSDRVACSRTSVFFSHASQVGRVSRSTSFSSKATMSPWWSPRRILALARFPRASTLSGASATAFP